MAYNVKFGKSELSDYCTVLNVNRSVLPSRSNFSKQIPTMDGSYFTGSKYEEKIISLEVAIFANRKEDYIQKVSVLAEVLNVREPQRLIISDEPYKLYYAVVDGSTNLEKLFNNGTVEIKFMCNDPFAESLYWNSYAPSEKGVINLTSYGNANSKCIVDVNFNDNACFFQLTNPKGQTVLVGKPKDATHASVPLSTVALNENCNDASTFISISESLLDKDRVNSGSHAVGLNGRGIICSNFGSSVDGKWTGTGIRNKTAFSAAQEFEVTVDVVFSSQGDNYVEPPPTPPPAPPEPPPIPPTMPPIPDPVPPPPVSLGTWKVVNCGGLWINRDANPETPLYPMSPGTLIYPVESSGNWFKHTSGNKWNQFTGWSSKSYLQKVSDNGKSRSFSERAYADEQAGIIEVYGYDKNGAKIFKLEVSDTNEYYEYVEPKCHIGSTLVLDDGKATPSARKSEDKNVASGVFGDFNDFEGQLYIKREKNSAGINLWACEIRKIENGKVVNTISTANSLSNSNYPAGDLAYVGVYIGRYGSLEPVSVIAVTGINVNRLNLKTDQNVSENVQIFKKGDHMQLDFDEGLVSINSQVALKHLDIGSEFFSIPPGNSQVAFRTDAGSASIICGLKDRFI